MAPKGPDVQVGCSGGVLTSTRTSVELPDDLDQRVAELRKAYRDNYEVLLCYALKRVNSFEEGQDIVQQSFTNALTAVEQGAQIRNIGGFVQRCVHNLCIDHSISEPRKPHLLLDEEICEVNEGSTVNSAELREWWRELEGILDKMAPSQRDVFLLAEIRGCSYEEISQTLGRSTNSVRQLLFRARQVIRAKADTESSWALGPFPVAGLDQIFSLSSSGQKSKIGAWVREKTSELQTWLGGIWQGSTDALLQPGVSVVTGAVVVALATVSPGPIFEPDSQGVRTDTTTTRKSDHSVALPLAGQTNTDVREMASAVVLPGLPSGSADDSDADRYKSSRDAPAKKSEDEEPESIIASDLSSGESPDPSTGQGENENPGGGGGSGQPCDLARDQEPCDEEGTEARVPCVGSCLTGHIGGPPPEYPLGRGPGEDPDEPPLKPKNEQEDLRNGDGGPDQQIVLKFKPDPMNHVNTGNPNNASTGRSSDPKDSADSRGGKTNALRSEVLPQPKS